MERANSCPSFFELFKTSPGTRKQDPEQTEPGRLAAKVSNGAGGRVPAAKAERPLSVQSRDVRGDMGQRARCAENGRSRWRRSL